MSPKRGRRHGHPTALRAAGHRAETLHDSDETHASLASGFGAEGDRIIEAVGAFVDELP